MELSVWLDAAAQAASEIATGSLGATSTTWEGRPATTLPGDLCGVYLPLLSDELALQFGFLATFVVCAKLSRALLGIAPDEELESEADVFDAVGEITNLVAGGVKARLVGRCTVNLGVPLALQGRVFPASGSRSMQGVIRIDESDVWLVMTGTPRSPNR